MDLIGLAVSIAVALAVGLALTVLVTAIRVSRVRLKRMRAEAVDLARVPAATRSILDVGRRWLLPRGFRYVSSWKIRPMLAKASEWKYCDVYVREDAGTFAVVSPREQPSPGDTTAIEFESVFADGSMMTTFNRYRHAIVWEPPGWTIDDDCVADLAQALDNHVLRVGERGAAPITDPAERDRIANKVLAGYIDAMVARRKAARSRDGEVRIRFAAAAAYVIKLLRGNMRAARVKIVPLVTDAPASQGASAAERDEGRGGHRVPRGRPLPRDEMGRLPQPQRVLRARPGRARHGREAGRERGAEGARLPRGPGSRHRARDRGIDRAAHGSGGQGAVDERAAHDHARDQRDQPAAGHAARWRARDGGAAVHALAAHARRFRGGERARPGGRGVRVRRDGHAGHRPAGGVFPARAVALLEARQESEARAGRTAGRAVGGPSRVRSARRRLVQEMELPAPRERRRRAHRRAAHAGAGNRRHRRRAAAVRRVPGGSAPRRAGDLARIPRHGGPRMGDAGGDERDGGRRRRPRACDSRSRLGGRIPACEGRPARAAPGAARRRVGGGVHLRPEWGERADGAHGRDAQDRGDASPRQHRAGACAAARHRPG